MGWKTQRVQHFLSDFELKHFYQWEWSDGVSDIREQFPLLPISETLEIACGLDIRHPKPPRHRLPCVLTTDIVLTRDGQTLAYSIKPSTELENTRVQEKLQIEHSYWANRGIKWKVATERELHPTLVANIQFLHQARERANINVTETELQDVKAHLSQRLQPDRRLSEVGRACDIKLNLPPGTSVMVTRYLLANKVWVADMSCPIGPNYPLILR
jgi:hypothetical protein